MSHKAFKCKLRDCRLSSEEFSAALSHAEALKNARLRSSRSRFVLLVSESSELPAWCRLIAELLRDWDALEITEAAPQLCCQGHNYLSVALSVPTEFALRTLKKRLDDFADSLQLTKSTWEGLRKEISFRLTRICTKALIRELHASRNAGRLCGTTPLERLKNFTNFQTRQREWFWAFMDKYQALPRLFGMTLQAWLDSGVEMFIRLQADRNRIERLLRCSLQPRLIVLDYKGTLSDLHRGGESVSILTLLSQTGDSLSLVYKPKPLSPDAVFLSLAQFINEKWRKQALRHDRALVDMSVLLRVPRVADCGAYGWMEHIPRTECHTKREVRKFYFRHGVLLGLFYYLGSYDFHYENIVAFGAFPVPVDLETFCGRTFRDPRASNQRKPPFHDLITRSVLATGLLPIRHAVPAGMVGRSATGDSAIRANAREKTETLVEVIRTQPADEIRIDYTNPERDLSEAMPRLDGHAVPTGIYAVETIRGLEHVLRLLRRHAKELVSPNGPLGGASSAKIRVVARDTGFYSAFCLELIHPDFLASAIDQENFLDSLWATRAKELWPIISSEQRDLLRGEIPYFSTTMESERLKDSTGKDLGAILTGVPPAGDIKSLSSLTDNMIDLQVQLASAALSSAEISRPKLGVAFSSGLRHTATALSPIGYSQKYLVDQALQIAERLTSRAMRHEGKIGWIGMTYGGDNWWRMAVAEWDLYGGSGGIGLFLAYLGHVAHETRFIMGAESSLRTMVISMDGDLRRGTLGGGYSGAASGVYALTHICRVLDRKICEEAPIGEWLTGLQRRTRIQRDWDVLNGAAGAIPSLLLLFDAIGDERCLQIAEQIGRNLILSASAHSRGLYWKRRGGAPLIGFAHGSAGMCWSLSKLCKKLHEIGRGQELREEIKGAIEASWRFDREQFDPSFENWPDNRDDKFLSRDRRYYNASWCNGSAGILIGRVESIGTLPLKLIGPDAEAARKTTKRLFNRNKQHDLCDGMLGQLMALKCTARPENHNTNDDNEFGALLHHAISDARCRGWVGCATSNHFRENPGLLNGLAGIGLGLLYQAYPNLVPAVIALEGPKL